MNNMIRTAALGMLAVSLLAGTGCSKKTESTATQSQAAQTQTLTPVKIGISIYTGWQPWYSGEVSGRLKATFAKYGLDAQVQEMDYGPSIDAYTSGAIDAVAITNMDALTSPVKSGVETTAVIVGDYSNGNDKIITKGSETSVCQLTGQTVYRLDASVSQYLLYRAVQKSNCKFDATALTQANVSDSAVEAAFKTDSKMRVAVTWNPMALNLAKVPGNRVIFDSSKIPGEIQDLMVVNSAKLKANPKIGQAFAEFWYNETKLMQGSDSDEASHAAKTLMAEKAANTLPFFEEQMLTTAMFYTPQAAVEFTDSDGFATANKNVYEFCVLSKFVDDNAVGISFPNGQVVGNKSNVKFHFDDSFMKAEIGKH